MIRNGFVCLLALISLSIPSFAWAQDSRTYAPAHCSFSATFPTAPNTQTQCQNDDDPKSCFTLASFTHVFDLNATVRTEIICNPATAEMYERFTPELMEATVRSMTHDNVVQAYHLNTRETDLYRQTTLVAQGNAGLDETLYIAQLWIDGASIMSVEAELSGAQRADADKMFADILRYIGHKGELSGEVEAKIVGADTSSDSE